MKKLFLDDLRTIDMVYDASQESDFDIVRTYYDFINYIKENGLPNFISFDNDLGLDEKGKVAPDGYAAAKWLVYESGLDLSRLEFKVHSANPVAAEQIKGLLHNYQKHIRSEAFLKLVESYCEEITSSNFSTKYDGLKTLVFTYNDIGLPGSHIRYILNEFISREGINEEVDEVVGEVLSCIAGYTSPSKVIELKEYGK